MHHGGRRRGWAPVHEADGYVVEAIADDEMDDDAAQRAVGDVEPLDFIDPFRLRYLLFNPFAPGWGVVITAGIVGVGVGFVAGYLAGEGSVAKGVGRAAGRVAEHAATKAGMGALAAMLG